MNIAFVIQDLYGRGAEAATAAVARGFETIGSNVDIVTSRRHLDLRRTQGETSFPLPKRAKWTVLPHARARYNIFALRRFLQKNDVDVVVVMQDSYMYAIVAASVGLRNCPMLVRVVHLDEEVAKSRPIGSMSLSLRWVMGGLSRIFFARMQRLFFVSEGGRLNFLKTHPYYAPQKTYTVYNPVVDDVFRHRLNNAPRHPWLIEKKCRTFVAAGQLEEIKGYNELLEAISIVCKKTRIRLVIFGEGKGSNDYEKYIRQNGLEDYVSLAGYSDNLPAELKSSDGLLHAAHREAFGIVLVEALASGIPVVSTDAPYGPREILDGGRFGTLVPVGDVVAMARAIWEMAIAPKQVVPMEAWSRFSVEEVVKRYLNGFRTQEERCGDEAK